jgi:chemotaxis methyl-accepting protein methylase
MSSTASGVEHVDAETMRRLVELVAKATGFDPGAIVPDTLMRALRSLQVPPAPFERVLDRALRLDAEVVSALSQAISVGETHFFRQLEHFRFVLTTVLPAWRSEHDRPFRVWSAGCATGEEAYSLAACLLDNPTALGGAPFEVLGTDLVERNIAAAHRAVYGGWALRGAAPALFNPFKTMTANRLEVRDEVRARVNFAVHNLLETPPAGPFDLIFCRNVLIYFSPESARAVCANLCSRMSSSGVMVSAAMDIVVPPVDIVRIATPELQVLVRRGSPLAPASHKPAAAVGPVPTMEAAPETATGNEASAPLTRPAIRGAIEPVAMHLRALAHAERGEGNAAEQLLDRLNRVAPDYVPGLLEHALLFSRRGNRGAALALMRRVLLRLADFDPDEPLPGPEPLPARFYVSTARTFLETESKR